MTETDPTIHDSLSILAALSIAYGAAELEHTGSEKRDEIYKRMITRILSEQGFTVTWIVNPRTKNIRFTPRRVVQ